MDLITNINQNQSLSLSKIHLVEDKLVTYWKLPSNSVFYLHDYMGSKGAGTRTGHIRKDYPLRKSEVKSIKILESLCKIKTTWYINRNDNEGSWNGETYLIVSGLTKGKNTYSRWSLVLVAFILCCLKKE